METKKFQLSKQYFLNALIILMLLIVFIVSKSKFILGGYESIITKVSYMVMLLCGLSGFLKQEKVDESAEKILSKVNDINMTVTRIGLLILFVIVGAPAFKKIDMTRDDISFLIILLLFIITSLKAILFLYYDRKGL